MSLEPQSASPTECLWVKGVQWHFSMFLGLIKDIHVAKLFTMSLSVAYFISP